MAGYTDETVLVSPIGKNLWKFTKDCDGSFEYNLKFSKVS